MSLRVRLPAPLRRAWRRWLVPRILDPGFLARAVANPLLRPFANAEASRLHDLVAGFVWSQTLLAALETGLLDALRGGGGMTAAALAPVLDLAPGEAERLAQAAAGLGLVDRDGDAYHLAPLGAAALAAPGVAEIVRHHRLLYGDLADPAGLLRGRRETALGRYWAYVGGGARDLDPALAADYSALMAATQGMVAAETLAAVPLGRVRRLLDVGGGNGAFLEAAARRHPRLEIALLDLPAVAAGAEARFRAAGLAGRASIHPGSFLDDRLPEGCDAVSLVRVLYDHDEEVVAGLLARVHACLPPGGLLIVSEPMGGGTRPNRVGDAYFGFYTLAMTSGRPRSPAAHAALLAAAGFRNMRHHPTRQGFVTSVLTARA